MTATAKKKKKPAPRGGRRHGAILDVVNEDMMSLKEAAALSCFQTKGKPASHTTMFRHIDNGLEVSWSTCGWKTSKQAVQRYFEKLNNVGVPLEKKQSANRRHQAATEELNRARI